jgi:hypothetical protein
VWGGEEIGLTVLRELRYGGTGESCAQMMDLMGFFY